MITYPKIQAMEAKGLTRSQIAALETANPSRYPAQEFTIDRMSNELAAIGETNPTALITRLIDALEAVAQNDRVVKRQLTKLEAGQPIDLGNFLVRKSLDVFAKNPNLSLQQADVDKLLSLAPVAPPVTVEDLDLIEQNWLEEQQRLAEEEEQRQAEEAEQLLLQSLNEKWNALWNKVSSLPDTQAKLDLVDQFHEIAEV